MARTTTASADEGLVDFADYARGVSRRKWIVVLFMLLGLLAGLAYSLLAGKSYSATSVVNVQSITTTVTGAGTNGIGSSQGVNINTEAALAASGKVAAAAAGLMKPSIPGTAVQSAIAVTPPSKANTLSITCTLNKATQAQQCAHFVAVAYLRQRQEQGVNILNTQKAAVVKQVAALRSQMITTQTALNNAAKGSPAETSAQANLQSLTQQIAPLQQTLTALNGVVVQAGQLVTDPAVPTTPAGLSKSILLAAGLGVGLLLGIVAALIRDRTDDRLNHGNDPEGQVGLPVLGVLPGRAGSLRRGADELVTLGRGTPYAMQVYGAVAARVMAAGEREGLRAFVVTSPMDSRATPVFAANIAISLANAGQRTALVALDRDGDLSGLFGFSGGPGLTDALATPDRSAVLREYPAVPLLRVVSGGSGPASAGLINPDALRHFLQTLREYADFVVIAAPPVLLSADTLVATSVADSTLLVLDTGVTHRRDVAESVERVESAGGRIFAAVMSGGKVPRSRRRSTYSGAGAGGNGGASALDAGNDQSRDAPSTVLQA